MTDPAKVADLAARWLTVADRAADLGFRLAALGDPRRRAARLRGRATKLRARALGGPVHKRARLLARADALDLRADALAP